RNLKEQQLALTCFLVILFSFISLSFFLSSSLSPSPSLSSSLSLSLSFSPSPSASLSLSISLSLSLSLFLSHLPARYSLWLCTSPHCCLPQGGSQSAHNQSSPRPT